MRTGVIGTLILAIFAAMAVPVLGATEIIPCAVGNKWEYSCVKLMRATIEREGRAIGGMRETSSGTDVYEVLSVDTSGPKPVYSYVENSELTSSSGQSESSKDELKITIDETGLKILETIQESENGKEPKKQAYDPPLNYFAANAAPGVAWEVGVMRDGETSTLVKARGVGKETVKVPAGEFKDCLKVVYESDQITGTIDLWEKEFTLTEGRTRGIYWIADGVGVVKEIEVSMSTAEGDGPGGKKVRIEGATCTVSELKPGYVVKN